MTFRQNCSWYISVLRNLAYKHIACLLRVESLVLLNTRASDLTYWSESAGSFLGPREGCSWAAYPKDHSQVQASIDSSKWIICSVVEAPCGRWAGWVIGILFVELLFYPSATWTKKQKVVFLWNFGLMPNLASQAGKQSHLKKPEVGIPCKRPSPFLSSAVQGSWGLPVYSFTPTPICAWLQSRCYPDRRAAPPISTSPSSLTHSPYHLAWKALIVTLDLKTVWFLILIIIKIRVWEVFCSAINSKLFSH